MKEANPFFDEKNIVRKLTEDDLGKTDLYLSPVKAFARMTYSSVYIIDYFKKGFEFVSDNPLFLCGHTAEEVLQMGYDFYFKHVPAEDLTMLLKINEAGFDFFHKIPKEERLDYSISYDFHLQSLEGKHILINHRLTPIFLNSEGKMWKALCLISLSAEKTSGNAKIFKTDESLVYKLNLDSGVWIKEPKIILSEREIEILQFSSRGYTVAEIAEAIFVSPDTVKFHRKKMFEKLDVGNITEAIIWATNNKML